MNKTITLNFVFKNWEKVQNSEEPQYLILRLLPYQRQLKTQYQLPPKHWDKKAQQVKPRYRKEHPELVKQINAYKDEFVKYYRLLDEGDIHPDAVCASILHTTTDHRRDIPMLEFINNNLRRFGETTGNQEKHRSHVRAVLKHLKAHSKSAPKELTVDMLKDKAFVSNVADALAEANLTALYVSNCMGTLNQIADYALDSKHHNPFKGYKPKYKGGNIKRGVPNRKLLDGLETITTYTDVAAYLLWLYSFSLQGLDIVDIANIDESKVIDLDGKPVDFTHYHPFGDLIGTKGDKALTQPLYLTGARKKSAGLIDCCFNMFPVLFIRDWLHYVLQMTCPELVYKGKDRLRLFNVTTMDSKFNEVKGAQAKIKAKMTYVTSRMKDRFGARPRLARQTYTQLGKKYFGYTTDQMDYQLNHKVSGVTNTYQQGEDAVTIRDYRHFQLMNHFEITEVLRYLRLSTMYKYKQGELIYFRKERAVPPRKIDGVLHGGKHKPPYMAYNNEMLIGQALLEFHKDSEWTKELQKEYDILQMEIKDKPFMEPNEKGLPVYTYLTPDHPNYPKRLIQLEAIRKKAFGDFPVTISKGGGIELTKKAKAATLKKFKDEAAQEQQEAVNLDIVNKIIEKG